MMQNGIIDTGGQLAYGGRVRRDGLERSSRVNPYSARNVVASFPLAPGNLTPGQLTGLSVRETTGGANASFILHNGQDVNGQDVLHVTLLPNESIRELYPDIDVSGGVYVEWVTGTFDIVAWVR